MNDYLESIIKRDPAAKSKLSIILSYPGVKSVFFHLISNKLWKLKFKNGSYSLFGWKKKSN